MVKKLIGIILRLLFPDFSNRITKIVVVFGLAMMSSSLLERVLNAIVSQFSSLYLNISISEGNDAYWGFLLVLLGLAHNISYQTLIKSNFISRLSPNYLNDEALFNRFLTTLPSHVIIEDLKYVDFLSEVRREIYEPLRFFLMEWDNAECAFTDDEMESIRSRLFEEISAFFELLGAYTFPVGHMGEYASVRDKRLDDHKKFHQKHIDEANEISLKVKGIIEQHQNLVKIGTAKYHVKS
ncbi:hypothetical protein [Desulfopila aestuarii]|uniref:Uncharacterized protein n=1 Tax=Desulfopila aestuarii DSM 18488 TaxID=1121416 RepID=A0A1M7YKL9_9BACT|nr:hypothetical protein [Desulfopila aestuarii]SHO53157.1 hypothetical protein SAMN02745220_04967 [Desulfopila aestuarii DSM 18488]